MRAAEKAGNRILDAFPERGSANSRGDGRGGGNRRQNNAAANNTAGQPHYNSTSKHHTTTTTTANNAHPNDINMVRADLFNYLKC